MQTSRIGAVEEISATPSTRSRKVCSPHWMSSRTTTSGACSSSSLRNAQAISSADVALLVSPSSDRIAAAAVGSDGQRVELLDHLDHRPVRDALAVGEAAAADDPGVDRGERLRDEARLADAGLADDRHQLAALLGERALPRRRGSSPTSRSRPTNRLSCERSGASSTATSRCAATGSALALELERLDRLGLDRAADELERRLADQDLVRGRRRSAGARRR